MSTPISEENANTTSSVKILSLAQAPGYRSAFLRLIESVFPKGSPVSRHLRTDEEFPLLLNHQNAERNLFIIDETLPKNSFPSWPVVAAASYRPFSFRLKGRPIPLNCAGIGLVVTSPEHQRKGYGHLIQSEIEMRAHKQDRALFSVLWSDLVQFYSKLGYVPAGTELQWQLDRFDVDILKKRLDAEVGAPAIDGKAFHVMPLSNFTLTKALYNEFATGPERDDKLYNELLALPDTFAYGAFTRDSNSVQPKLISYALMGKARDLRDTMHEFIGEEKTFPHLLKAMIPHSISGLRVYYPADSSAQSTLEHWLGASTRNALSFFKVIDGPGLVEWFEGARFLPKGFGITGTQEGFQLLNRHITFFESHDFGHLLQLFFGPWKISEMEGLPQSLQAQAGAIKNQLPLYFWGFDSV